jgi:hypothetical protein
VKNPEDRQLSVQEKWGQAAARAIETARRMTPEEMVHQARVNSGYYEDHPEAWPESVPKP